MKKYEVTIVLSVDDDVRADQIGLFDHDVCDGLELILMTPDNTSEFKLQEFRLAAVKEINGVTKEDILDVAKKLELELTESQIAWALLSYEDAQRQDPTATWNLIVEDLLYMIKTNFEG
jgi:hypothetical protein